MSLPVTFHAPGALLLTLLLLATAVLTSPVAAKGPPEAVRFATFNASLNRNEPGQALVRPVGAIRRG